MRKLLRGAIRLSLTLTMSLAPVASVRAEDAAATLAERFSTVRALVVSRGDCVVFEYYRKGISPETRSPVHSIAKSVLSILIGVAIDKGRLRLDEKLGEALPESLEGRADPGMREITIRDLLTMTGGFDGTPGSVDVPETEMWRWMLEGRLRYPPGSHFEYNGKGPNLLSVALSRAIHQKGDRFARENLFRPLGIENYVWDSDAEGHLIGDTDLFLTARDMAKIGLLYLQQGLWNGASIVSGEYVADSTMRHNDGGPPVRADYGYLWWVGRTRAQLDTYFAAGSGSQLIAVVPSRNLVVALAADSIPGGSRAFLDDFVAPFEAALPASAPCVVRLRPDRAP
jgi:CubicO group peptidase (beta-lactamase class C family)